MTSKDTHSPPSLVSPQICSSTVRITSSYKNRKSTADVYSCNMSVTRGGSERGLRLMERGLGSGYSLISDKKKANKKQKEKECMSSKSKWERLWKFTVHQMKKYSQGALSQTFAAPHKEHRVSLNHGIFLL